MISKWHFIVPCVLLSACVRSSYVDRLQKCSLKDEQCFKTLLHNFLEENSKSGVPEINIPPFSPFELRDISVAVPDLINATLVEGTVMGVDKCIIKSMEIQPEKGKAKVGLTCDLVLKGKYTMKGTGPILKSLFGGNFIHGDGNIKVKLSQVKMSFKFYFDFIKKEDGDVYFQCHPEKFKYDCDIGGVHMSADKIFLGKEDASESIVGFFNQNWKMLLDSFGKDFVDTAMGIFNNVLHKFFDSTPTKNYIIEDLSYLVKN